MGNQWDDSRFISSQGPMAGVSAFKDTTLVAELGPGVVNVFLAAEKEENLPLRLGSDLRGAMLRCRWCSS